MSEQSSEKQCDQGAPGGGLQCEELGCAAGGVDIQIDVKQRYWVHLACALFGLCSIFCFIFEVNHQECQFQQMLKIKIEVLLWKHTVIKNNEV